MATLAQQQKPAPINKNWKSVPILGCKDEEAKTYLLRHFNDKGRYRRWNMVRMARNKWFYLGRQWIKEDRNLRADSGGLYRFSEVRRRSGASFPRPQDNFIADGVDNLQSRLGRREFEPSTRPTKNTPEIEAAARLAKDVLLYDMEEQLWADKREELSGDIIIGGTGIARSVWDETATDLSVLASPDAVGCPVCETKLASSKVPLSLARIGIPTEMGPPMPIQHTETIRDVERTDPSRPPEVELTHCPTCVEPTPLQPYDVSMEEAQGSEDVFGRPMGLAVPKGQGLIEVVSPADIYPQNGGVGIEPHTCRIWGQKTVRDMEWIATHLPDYADKIEPEPAADLMRLDPILGDDAFSGPSRGQGTEEDVYFNHAAVMELYVDPIPLPGLEMGRRFVMVGEHVCRNDELMIPVEVPDGPPRKVARVKYGAARCKRIPKQFWGRTPVDDAVPLQKRLNELDAMMQDIREKGMPRIFVPPGTDIEQQDDAEGALDVVEVDCAADPSWDIKKGLFAGQPLTGNVYMSEREAIVQSIRRVLGPQDVEMGANPTGVKAAQQLQILAEEAAQKRGPLERSFVNLTQLIFEHHLEITWALRREDTTFQAQRDAGAYEQVSYKGENLLGQTKVKVEAKGTFDKTVYQKEATKEGIAAHLYDDAMQSEAGRDELRESMGLPKITTERSIQIERANSDWREFVDHHKITIIDPTLHDPGVRFQVLGARWESDEGVKLRKEANFDQIVLPKIAGWDQRLKRAEATDDLQRQAYEGQDPQTWGKIYQQAAAMAKAANVPTPMPPPPANGQLLPPATEERIFQVLAASIGMQPIPPEQQGVDPESLKDDSPLKQQMVLEPMLREYSVIQAYRWLDKKAQEAAMAGAPMPAAPTGATAQGAPA
jgi:hypothetical protein